MDTLNTSPLRSSARETVCVISTAFSVDGGMFATVYCERCGLVLLTAPLGSTFEGLGTTLGVPGHMCLSTSARTLIASTFAR